MLRMVSSDYKYELIIRIIFDSVAGVNMSKYNPIFSEPITIFSISRISLTTHRVPYIGSLK